LDSPPAQVLVNSVQQGAGQQKYVCRDLAGLPVMRHDPKSVDLAAKVVDRFKDGRKRIQTPIVGVIKFTLGRQQKLLRRHGIADLALALCRHKHV
jgi:hypothetical protein